MQTAVKRCSVCAASRLELHTAFDEAFQQVCTTCKLWFLMVVTLQHCQAQNVDANQTTKQNKPNAANASRGSKLLRCFQNCRHPNDDINVFVWKQKHTLKFDVWPCVDHMLFLSKLHFGVMMFPPLEAKSPLSDPFPHQRCEWTNGTCHAWSQHTTPMLQPGHVRLPEGKPDSFCWSSAGKRKSNWLIPFVCYVWLCGKSI